MSNKKSTYSYFIHDIHEYMSNLPPRAPAPRAAHQRQLCVCSCVTQALSVFSIARFRSGGSHFWGLFWGWLVSGKEDFGFWLLFFVIIGGNMKVYMPPTKDMIFQRYLRNFSKNGKLLDTDGLGFADAPAGTPACKHLNPPIDIYCTRLCRTLLDCVSLC